MIWLLYAPLNIVCMILGYLTNPIVCLFANEEGELPGFLHYWQTWDDSLNPRFYVLEHAPKIFRYDYDKHYKEYWGTTPKLAALGRKRCFVHIVDPNFTMKERIQRYFCRVLWLYRNCAYGFAFYVFGRFANGTTCKGFDKRDDAGHRFYAIWDTYESVLTRVWSVKSSMPITKHIRWEVYLGWKIDPSVDEDRQCMITNRIAFRFMK